MFAGSYEPLPPHRPRGTTESAQELSAQVCETSLDGSRSFSVSFFSLEVAADLLLQTGVSGGSRLQECAS